MNNRSISACARRRFDEVRCEDRERALDECQRRFAAALVDSTTALPDGLVGPDGMPATRRFDVYRNNRVCGLVDALRAGFPAVRRLVGDDFFAAMARVHAGRSLPVTPMMLDYGADFAEFVYRFEPAAVVPYLSDVARLERAWLEAYHAAEASPLEAQSLRELAVGQFAELGFTLHPSLRVVRSRYPIVTLWRMNRDADEPPAFELDGNGQDALVVRPGAEVHVRELPVGAASFITTLASGDSLLAATSAALADDRHFELANVLTDLFTAGAVIGWSRLDERRGDVAGRPA